MLLDPWMALTLRQSIGTDDKVTKLGACRGQEQAPVRPGQHLCCFGAKYNPCHVVRAKDKSEIALTALQALSDFLKI